MSDTFDWKNEEQSGAAGTGGPGTPEGGHTWGEPVMPGESSAAPEAGSSQAPEAPAPEAVGMPPVQGGQQSQWSFYDYGPIGGNPPPRKEKKAKDPKPPKPSKEKKPRQPGGGYKALAVLMCVLFVLSTAGFGSYIVYDLNREPVVQQPAGDGGTVSTPTLDQTPTPDVQEEPDPEGKLTGNQIHQLVEPAVVGVIGYVKTPLGNQAASQGSGVVMSTDGYVITNNHVISDEQTDQAYEAVEVCLPSGDRYEAAVVGKDKESDLAVLKIEATGLTAAVFGDSDQAKVGDRAYVIGNPSGLEFAGSFTGGYISAVNRYVDVEDIGTKVEFIQTDAAINPGNSGGALVNEYGQVIGITSAKLVDSAYEGMGFAIPINNVKPIVDSLIEYGWVRGRVQIGISYVAVPESISDWAAVPAGLRVAAINEDSDVKNTRIQLGDIIYAIDGEEVYDAATIAEALKNKKPGDTVTLSVFHVNLDDTVERFDVEIVLQEKPNENQ